MDTTDLEEKKFEADIERYLLSEGGYVKGNQKTYSKERAIDMATLIKFIETTQPKEWKRYTAKYGDRAETQLYRVFQDSVSSCGLISVLRKGITDFGIPIKFCYFAPASELNEALVVRYKANILEATRQFRYTERNNNSIDMVLSLNGIPVVALELKNQFMGQNIENSRKQWIDNREPQELIFNKNSRILAYFGVDLYEAIMSTELKGAKTFFMPFNQGSAGAGNVGGAGNPATEDGDYVTSYLWKRVLKREMLLSILQRYISLQREEKLSIVVDKHGREKEKKTISEKIIFPRYHQLDVVEKLVTDTAEKGAGQNYLVQHSAGSGKSNSIAWLTYRLASLHSKEMIDTFNTVFVITDRRVLNKQLQDTILGFDHVVGHIVTITDTDPSTKLRDTINEDATRIVITTLHRFPIIYKELVSRSGKRYAIIVDEAHSSQSGKSADKLKAALADTDDALRELAQIEEKSEEQIEKEKDALLEDLLTQGQHINLSFYAFTATPKPKTLQTFGVKIHEGATPEDDKYVAHHIYSMLQAIEEGFIKDVLKYYTPYSTTYEIAKQIENNPEYEETPATRAIKAFHDSHQHVIEQKTAIIVEKFKEVTMSAMGGSAKAMVVCSSRAHAVRYFMEIKKYCRENHIEGVNPMVAFSGKVSYNGTEYTESKLNSTEARNISEAKLPLYFASELYNILVVADKYQTGFDEPLLHTMFVDKKLKNVKAVQTLSRLNRSHKDKKDTYVLDFVNDTDSIKNSFEPFYTSTELIKPVDVNYVYSFRSDIEQYNLWREYDEEEFYKLILTIDKQHKNRLALLSNAFKPVVERYEELEEEKRFEARAKIKNFVRFYSYMAQIARTFDKSLYKAYVFADYLYRLLPKDPHEKVDLNKQIMLVNSKISAGETLSIKLEGEAPKPIKGENPKGGKKPDESFDLLSNIIDKVNIMYQGDFSAATRVIAESIIDKLSSPRTKSKIIKQVNNTDEKQFTESIFPEIFNKQAEKCYDEQMAAFAKLFEDKNLYQNMMSVMAQAVYKNYKQESSDLPFVPHIFTEKLLADISGEFTELQKYLPKPEDIVSKIIKIINSKTIDSIDGMNDVLIDSFNHLYCLDNIALADKRRHVNTLITNYEPFLKKLYYIQKCEEMVSSKGEESMPTFIDCIFAFPCLKGLKYNSDERYKKFYTYLELVKGWRNDTAHAAPNISLEELNATTHIVATMYYFVVSQNM